TAQRISGPDRGSQNLQEEPHPRGVSRPGGGRDQIAVDVRVVHAGARLGPATADGLHVRCDGRERPRGAAPKDVDGTEDLAALAKGPDRLSVVEEGPNQRDDPWDEPKIFR